MQTLVIGGTRNLGPGLVRALVARGDRVTILHRGRTQASLPEVERLYADRSDSTQFAQALAERSFDLAVDMTLYNGPDAEAAAAILRGRVGQYVMISTGQVYLVRAGLKRPFREDDYGGPTIPAPPKENDFDYRNWLYGDEKRAAEDALFRSGLPVTVLRLPMVNSELDHYDRILSYLARLWDGGPILLPEGPHLLLRHVYGEDVVRAILRVSECPHATGRAYNISQEETIDIESFLAMLGEAKTVRLPLAALEGAGVFPWCSPFSEPWMSALDNERSKSELGMSYTPLPVYVEKLVAHFSRAPRRAPLGYDKRPAELALL